MFSTVTLARIQFAMATAFHFFFVPFSIGLAFVIATMGIMYVTRKGKRYHKMAKSWGNIFLLGFAVGVVTGIVQGLQFGTNWSDYSRPIGDVFRALLAAEALLAFFSESTFLGLWIFTWDRVSPRAYATFIWLVVFGSMMSAFWILVANSFMQRPVGYVISNGRAKMMDLIAAINNLKVWYELSYVIMDAFTLGGMAVVGVAVFQLLKKRDISLHRAFMRIGLWVTLFDSIGVLLAGDLQMRALIRG